MAADSFTIKENNKMIEMPYEIVPIVDVLNQTEGPLISIPLFDRGEKSTLTNNIETKSNALISDQYALIKKESAYNTVLMLLRKFDVNKSSNPFQDLKSKSYLFRGNSVKYDLGTNIEKSGLFGQKVIHDLGFFKTEGLEKKIMFLAQKAVDGNLYIVEREFSFKNNYNPFLYITDNDFQNMNNNDFDDITLFEKQSDVLPKGKVERYIICNKF